LANMRAHIFSGGSLLYTITPDMCKVADINIRQERKAFEFVASDFSFSMKNGETLYGLLASGSALDIIVRDDSGVWFNGALSYEGSGWTAGRGEHDFAAVSSAKAIVDRLKTETMNANYIKMGLQYDSVYDDYAYVLHEAMSAALYRATKLNWRIADFAQHNANITYQNTDLTQEYSVWEFVKDCAYQQNAVFWIDSDNTLRMKERAERLAPTSIDSDLIFSYKDSLRVKDYDKILYTTITPRTKAEIDAIVAELNMYLERSRKEPNSQQWKDKIKELTAKLAGNGTGGTIAMIEESLVSGKMYASMPDSYDYTGVLDIRVPRWSRGKDEAVYNSIFGLRRPGSSANNMRLGEWDSLMKQKHITEIGLRGLTRYDSLARVKCLNAVGSISEISYDIVKETTTITVESEI